MPEPAAAEVGAEKAIWAAKPRRRGRAGRGRLPEVSARAAAALFSDEPAAPPPAEASSGAPANGRRPSEVTPGATSRWSNQGAMEPIPSPVPLQSPLPERSIPRAPGVATPGQRLRDDVDRLSARLSFSGYQLAAMDDAVQDRDIQLLRGRATLGYERIAGTELSTHLDVEYRPRLSGDGRFDDQRVNELNVAWGLTDGRPRADGPDFGVALGRVAVREAGFAQADGLLVRWRPLDGLNVGAFGGVTGNPYGFNWALRDSQTFSTDWVTGGMFARWRGPGLQASLAGVVTVSNVPRPPPDPGSLDRIYASADVAWQPHRDLSVFATGFFDMLPSTLDQGRVLIQNADVVGTWTPERWTLSLGLGRFSTLSYELSNGVTFLVDPGRNAIGVGQNANAPIVDEDGQAIVPFDGARLTAIYNQIRVSAGYRLLDELETYVRVNTLIRDVSLAMDQTDAALGTENAPTVDFAPLRLLPTAGARYRNPDLVDVEAAATWIVDDQSQADAIVQIGVGRSLGGLRAQADARYLFGAIGALDGGLSLIYGLPRDWFPGLLQLRVSARYFREDLALERPTTREQGEVLGEDEQRPVLPAQESFLGFAGVEWRL